MSTQEWSPGLRRTPPQTFCHCITRCRPLSWGPSMCGVKQIGTLPERRPAPPFPTPICYRYMQNVEGTSFVCSLCVVTLMLMWHVLPHSLSTTALHAQRAWLGAQSPDPVCEYWYRQAIHCRGALRLGPPPRDVPRHRPALPTQHITSRESIWCQEGTADKHVWNDTHDPLLCPPPAAIPQPDTPDCSTVCTPTHAHTHPAHT